MYKKKSFLTGLTINLRVSFVIYKRETKQRILRYVSRSTLFNLAGYHDEMIASRASRLEKYDAPRMFEKKKKERKSKRHRRRVLSHGMHSHDSKCMHERAAHCRLDIQGGGRGWVASPQHSPPRPPAGLKSKGATHILVSNSCMRSCKKGDKWKNS